MKRAFLWLLTAIVLASFHSAEAQQPGEVPRIGYISGSGSPNIPEPRFEAFRQGPRSFGYTDGKNLLIEYRGDDGHIERVPILVRELLELKVDVLVSPLSNAIRIAQQITKSISIVMMITGDPVATGIVASLARPGGNVTGLTRLSRDLTGKRLELLKEAVSGASTIGVLWDAKAPGPISALRQYEAGAPALNLRVQSLAVRNPSTDFETAFQAAVKGHADAVITVINPVFDRFRSQIAVLAIKTEYPRCTRRVITLKVVVSCPTRPSLLIALSAARITWIESSKVQIPRNCRWSSRRSLNW